MPGSQRRVFPKGAYVYHAGEPVRALGVVLSGSVSIESDDFWGNKSILDRWKPAKCLPRLMPVFRKTADGQRSGAEPGTDSVFGS